MRGFTLLEMLIVIIILGTIASVLLPNYNKFAANINLRRNAQEIALAIREVQASAFAVRGFDHDNNSGTPLLFKAWGINFNKTVSDSSFTIFVDSFPAITPNKQYDTGQDENEFVRTVPISNFIKIKKLGKGLRSGEVDDDTLNRIDIVYQRPNPDTTLRGDLLPVSGTYPDVEIIIENADGAKRTIVVWSTGQISVE